MEIRIAQEDDLKACLEVDDSFETEYVWQMDEQNRTGHIATNFRLTHLPRPMRVTHVISGDELVDNFYEGSTLLVACDTAVRGFLDISRVEWNQVAYINNFAISPAYRRQGLGARMLRIAFDWGRQQQLRIVMLDTSTKNYPAICFYQKHGFQFCGFNDQLYPNHDIGLYFAQNIR